MAGMTANGATMTRRTTGTAVRRELSRQELNRATLARQSLLTRADRPALDLIEHLVGLQAQAPDAPYVGLWSRLADWQPEELAEALTGRQVVRTSLMRSTIHLVTARDACELRPLIQPVLTQDFRGSAFAKEIADVPMPDLLAFGAELLARQPMRLGQLKPLLAARWPGRDPTSLAYAVAFGVPLVQVTPRGVWGSTGPATLTTLAGWLGPDAVDRAPSTLDRLVLRYLAAFGPATVKDIQLWCGLSRLNEVVARLGSSLIQFTDDRGATLYDLPDAPRPAADTPAPVRFLPEYDNVLLSHADRRRVIPDGRRVPLPPGNGAAMGTVLVRGDFSAVWRITRAGDSVTLTVSPFARLSDDDATDVVDEGARLLSFVAGPPGSHRVLIA